MFGRVAKLAGSYLPAIGAVVAVIAFSLPISVFAADESTQAGIVSSADSPPVAWRRTVDGWEDRDLWQLEPVRRPVSEHVGAIHPGLSALLVLLLSLGALLAFDGRDANSAEIS
ncbi:MAG: hypothetical protein KDA60_08210 [Planctomycetales bacterium]|nr:hypothetical protein [Planctomycetales bacterium]